MTTPTPPFDQSHPNTDLINKSLNVYHGSEETKKYLIKAPTETEEEFKNRQKNFSIAPFYKSGIDSIINIIMRNPITYSDDMRQDIKDIYSKNIDGNNTSLNEYAKNILRDLLLTNKNFTNVFTQQGESERPYINNIARNRVSYIIRGGIAKQIAIKGSYLHQKDRYNIEHKEEHKIYFEDGLVEVWREGKHTGDIQTEYQTIPIVETTFQGDKSEFLNDKPPFLDLAKLQIRWGETDSRKNEFVNRLAIPIVISWGMDLETLSSDSTETAVNKIGDTYKVELAGSRGWMFPISQDGKKLGDIEFRELSGENDTVLKGNLVDIENQIKAGFIKFVKSEKGSKTVTESQNERVDAESQLSSIANLLDDALNEINELFFALHGKKEKELTGKVGIITVNKDFLDTKITDLEYQILSDLNENGLITNETLLGQLKEGGTLKGVNVEDEVKKLEAKGI